MSDRGEQRQQKRQQQQQRLAANEARKRRNAPSRIRVAAEACTVWGVSAVAVGFFSQIGTPEFGGDAYTEMVDQLASINGSVAWLAAVVLFALAAKFGGDAYTEMVDQLASINGSVAWLAAVVLFVSAALLKALADMLDELMMQTGDGTAG